MPFFFIAPLWLLCVIAGLVFLTYTRTRVAGVYILTVSTGATLLSFALSTAVLLVVPRVLGDAQWKWAGVFVIAAYLGAIILGGIAGAIAGAVLGWRINRRAA